MPRPSGAFDENAFDVAFGGRVLGCAAVLNRPSLRVRPRGIRRTLARRVGLSPARQTTRRYKRMMLTVALMLCTLGCVGVAIGTVALFTAGRI
jgi:hypothetical protein